MKQQVRPHHIHMYGLLTLFFFIARPVGRPRKRHRRDDKYASDGTVSDSKPKRASSVSSQPEETPRTSEQRQYPYYLLNEDSAVPPK